MTKALVLGGFGFVGGHLVGRLKAEGYDAIPESRRSGFDLLDVETTQRRLREIQPDVIFNCAAHVGSVHYVMAHAATVVHENMLIALNLYRGVVAACPKAHIIHPLANCSYPGDATVQTESEWRDGPVHSSVLPFGETRRMIYALAQSYQSQYGVRTSNFLVGGVFGPGDYADTSKTHALAGLVLRLIRAKRANDPTFEIWGTGKPVREWIYAEDLAALLVAGSQLERDLTYPVNIARNEGHSIGDLAKMIANAVGYEGELTFNSQYPDGAPVKVLDNRRFRELFPDFRFTDMEEGIRHTVAYYERALA